MKKNDELNNMFRISFSKKPSRKLSFFYTKYLKKKINRNILLKLQEEIKIVI